MTETAEPMVEISERLAALREFEVHYRRWALHEFESVTDTAALLAWLPEDILAHKLPTNRSVREHLELQKSEGQRVVREVEERMLAARNLTTQELWERVDPLPKEPRPGNPQGWPEQYAKVKEARDG